jgi:hypothetical protein
MVVGGAQMLGVAVPGDFYVVGGDHGALLTGLGVLVLVRVS